MLYRYIYADRDTYVALSSKNSFEIIKAFIEDLKAKYPGERLVIHFSKSILQLSPNYNNVYEIIRKHFHPEVIACE